MPPGWSRQGSTIIDPLKRKPECGKDAQGGVWGQPRIAQHHFHQQPPRKAQQMSLPGIFWHHYLKSAQDWQQSHSLRLHPWSLLVVWQIGEGGRAFACHLLALDPLLKGINVLKCELWETHHHIRAPKLGEMEVPGTHGGFFYLRFSLSPSFESTWSLLQIVPVSALLFLLQCQCCITNKIDLDHQFLTAT